MREGWTVEYEADGDVGLIAHEGVRQTIQFQHGPIGDNGFNGVQNEEILQLLITRTQALNERFPCEENANAIAQMKNALHWFSERTRKRVEQGVEGKNEAHV